MFSNIMATASEKDPIECNLSNSSEIDEANKPDWMLAKEGIKFIINNEEEKAKEVFSQRKNSLVVHSGYAMSVFMDALMTLEDEKFTEAMTVLKDLEKKCTADTGWFKTVRARVFGGTQEEEQSLEQTLETQIILADSLVCLAILIFMQQELSGYFKGSWVLRKSWKIYQSVYNDILQLYKANVGEFVLPETLQVARRTSNGSNPELETPDEIDSPASNSPSSEKPIDNSPSSEKATVNNPLNEKATAYELKNGYTKSQIPHSQSAFLDYNRSDNATTSYRSSRDSPLEESSDSGLSSPNSPCNASTGSNKQRSKRGGSLFLKKSTSVNGALSSHLKRSNSWSKFTPFSSTISLSYFTSTFNIFSSNEKLDQKPIDKDTIVRLMGAVTFGYGLFHLGISLLPTSLLKFTNLLGFRGNRKIGASCLMYARLGVDMRAPLASLTLLWYYTIVRPFYALDGNNIRAGVDYAELLIRESEQEYSGSALFLFFKGRVHRLQSDIPASISAFQLSVNKAKREVKNLSLHEVGWCYLIQLDFKAAEETFADLKIFSRWSRPFYMYLSSICTNCYQTCFAPLLEFKTTVQGRSKQSQLDEFLVRRANCCPSTAEDLEKLSPIYWNFLVYEMLYLWNAMPSCNTHSIRIMIEDCESLENINGTKEEPMVGLSQMILGAAFSLQGQYFQAVDCFRKCLELRKVVPNNAPDAHISAFSQYELGCLLLKSQQTEEEGKELLKTLSQYRDYDFEQRLSIRVQSLLKNL